MKLVYYNKVNLPTEYKKPVNQELINKLLDYIQLSCKYLSKLGLSKTMIGIYEDTNCLVAAKLLKQALGENAAAMIFDLGTANTNSLIEFCNSISLTSYILKRGEAYQTEVKAYNLHKEPDLNHFYKRFINYHLQIQAEHMKTALVDTIDKSDRLLGTRPEGFYGQLMPFYSFYKSEILDIAKFLGIPDKLINTSSELDPVLYLLAEKLYAPEQISQQYNLDLNFVKKLKSRIDKQPLKSTPSQFII